MSEEYVWKETTGNIALLEMKANYNVTFHNGGKQLGVLDFNGPEMTFSGDMEESAKVFFDWIARSFKARLDQERADAQRTWVGLTDEMVVAAARVLNERQADACGVDRDDQWAIYSNDFKADARAMLEAVNGIKEKNT